MYFAYSASAVSTAQPSQPAHATKHVRADREWQRKEADRVGSSLHAAGHGYNSLRCQNAAVSKRTMKSKSARQTNHTTTHKAAYEYIWCCDVACALLFFLSILSYSSIHPASESFTGTMELLAFAIRQFAPKTMDLSVCFTRSLFVPTFIVRKRCGRRKPPPERSAL